MIHYYLIPVIVIAVTVIMTAVAYCSVKFFMRKTGLDRKPMELTELLQIMSIITDTEISMYEHSIFTKKGAITNSNYENFYKDITERIFKAFPDSFFEQISHYMSEEEAISLICEKVHKYLREKATKIK